MSSVGWTTRCRRRPQMLEDDKTTFAADTSVLRRPDAPEGQTAILQRLLNFMGLDCGKDDGVFGGRTEAAVRTFQQIRLQGEHGRVADGVVGPVTRAELVAAFAAGFMAGQTWRHQRFDVEVWGGLHPTLGAIPDGEGKMSTFGGPDDVGDRGYGQALVPVLPATVARLYEQHPDLVALGVFRGGLSDPLPMVTCCGKVMRAGISWCLDPASYYIAMRWGTGRHRPNPSSLRGGPAHRVLVVHGDRACVCAPTDWGPAQWTGRDSDLSPGCADAIHLEPLDGKLLGTDSVVQVLWAADGAPLGPVTLR